MNMKQSLRAASQKIDELEAYNKSASRDIARYNEVIVKMIMGGSPCEYCEEQNECQLQAKADGKGCGEWWLKFEEEKEHEFTAEDIRLVFEPDYTADGAACDGGADAGLGPVQAGDEGEHQGEGLRPQ